MQIAAAAGGLPVPAACGSPGDATMDDGVDATAAVAADDHEATAAAGATAGVGSGAGGVTMPPPAFVLLGVLSAGE
jgi:hypothetical protein